MTAVYNKARAGALEGNWVEEGALNNLTGTRRYEPWVKLDGTRVGSAHKLTDTGKRIVYHTESEHKKDRDLDAARSVTVVKVSKSGPRAAAALAAAESAAVRATQAAAAQPAAEWTTATRELQVRHADEEYTSPKGRRVMKTIDGVPIPPEARDLEFLRANGLSTLRPTVSADEAAALLPAGDLISQTPVTMYSQRLPEGAYGGTGASGANPFARDSKFTNDIREAHQSHADARDDPAGTVKGIKSALISYVASELSAIDILKVMRAKIKESSGLGGLQSLAAWFRRADTSGDGVLQIAEISSALVSLRINATAREIQGLFALMDTDHSGYLSYDELLNALCGPISPARQAVIDAAYLKLRNAAGKVPLAALVETYDPNSHPSVRAGVLSAQQAREEFLAAWEADAVGGYVTEAMFKNFYNQYSALVTDDSLFVSMVRRAYGLGSLGTTSVLAPLRVRVIHLDGTSSEVTIEEELGVGREDMPLIRAILRRKGVKAVHSVHVL